MLSENNRFIALDFETTGLDINSDEPIQIGILEFDIQGKIIGGYQSLLHPRKPLKELKSIVGFITGLSLEKLDKSPYCEDILDEISPYFGENTIIIGHNIDFDLSFLKKFFPKLKRKTSIDTFRLAQALIHYPQSYALEILIKTLEEKEEFKKILGELIPFTGEHEVFHDAFYDAKLTIALFRYLLNRVETLFELYPVLKNITFQSEGSFASIFKKENLKNYIIDLPTLKKISAPTIFMTKGEYELKIKTDMDKKRYQVINMGLRSLMSSIATNKKNILAFSNKSKMDIAKNILIDLGIKNLGYLKETQTINKETLKELANKGHFSEIEYYFFIKYFSHIQQGLGILDLNTKGDLEIYTALKDQREIINYPIVLATHGGLYAMLEQKEKYKDYNIIFFDIEWWSKTYTTYLSRPYDLNYTLNYLDMLSYKYSLKYELTQTEEMKENINTFEEFKQFFMMFMGILGQETKKFFTNTDVTKQTIDPLKNNIAFYQTNKLLLKFPERKESIQKILHPTEFLILRKQIEHMYEIFDSVMTVEKKMRGKSEFYFVYAEEVKFSDWNDFVDQFQEHTTLFLSNANEQNEPLVMLTEKQQQDQFRKREEILSHIDHLSKKISVMKRIEELEKEMGSNGIIFILSVKKDESIELFENLIKDGYDKKCILLVENITGGVGKNLFKAKGDGKKILIGGYNFLLQFFAQKIAISQLIIYNSKGSQEDLIFRDIIRYGQETLC